MILPDTSVWVDHLRYGDATLTQALHDGKVIMHIMVIGELACGNLANRARQLRDWRALPRIQDGSHEDVLTFIESSRLMGRGIGLVDAHLLFSVFNHQGSQLWTKDNSLRTLAEELGIAYHSGT